MFSKTKTKKTTEIRFYCDSQPITQRNRTFVVYKKIKICKEKGKGW